MTAADFDSVPGVITICLMQSRPSFRMAWATATTRHDYRLAGVSRSPAATADRPAQPSCRHAPDGSARAVQTPQPAVDAQVRARHHCYSKTDPWVLDGVDLRITPGQTVAIVGPSGCGKT